MNVLIRTDASSEIGSGHVFRCLSLAEELGNRGHKIEFICRAEFGNLISLIESRGFPCHQIRKGADFVEDAAVTRAAAGSDVRWLVVDHYGLDAEWELEVRRDDLRLAVFDDLANRPHECDILIDSAHEPEDAALYDGLVPRAAIRLVGPNYVPLRREFFSLPQPQREYSVVRRLLVTLGGNDPQNFTGTVLEAAADRELAHLSIDLTIGLSNPLRANHEIVARWLSNVTLYVQHNRLSELMLDADLCVGAGGQTTWERFYLGLPSLTVSLADNQIEFAERLHRKGYLRYLGLARALKPKNLVTAIRAAAADPIWRTQCGRKGQQLVDGQGTRRIVSELEVSAL